MTKVTVVDGDITQIKSDGLVTAINSGGLWFGGVDSAIQRVSGKMFHKQASEAMPLRDGQVVFAPAKLLHNGRFDSVIFVVDDLEQPVGSLVRAALEEADAQLLATISIPSLRTGVMAGMRETRAEALEGLAIAVSEFVNTKPRHVEQITVVVHENEGDRTLLERLFLKSELLASVESGRLPSEFTIQLPPFPSKNLGLKGKRSE